jgi:hypothetical protein
MQQLSSQLPLEHRHLRTLSIRRMRVMSIVGGLLSLFFGASIVLWIIRWIPWAFHQIPFWHIPGNAPDILASVRHPDLRYGLIWIAYYLLFYWLSILIRSPRQRQRDYWQYTRDSWDHEEGIDPLGSSFSQKHQKKKPLSHAWPGELKHQLVERCYEQYRKALERFNPKPFELRTPLTFAYREDGQAEWENGELVLPKHLLTPERIHELLPFLARLLRRYNAPEVMTPEDLEDYPDHTLLPSWILLLTGNFLWLLVSYKHSIEEDSLIQQKHQTIAEVHEDDAFAVTLGQGPDLEHTLRFFEQTLQERGQVDTSRPTLSERIGHLEVLNEKERQEMRNLGLKPKQPPLVKDRSQRQLGDGRDGKN